MDYWLNVLILIIIGSLCFYVGYRVGFVDCEFSGMVEDCDAEDKADEPFLN